MHKLRQLLTPTSQEIWLYFFLSLAALLTANVHALWLTAVKSASTDVGTEIVVSRDFNELIGNITSLSDPQIINAAVWGVTAVLGFMFALALTDFVQSVSQDRKDASRGGKRTFMIRIIARIGAALSCIWFGLLLAVGLFPILSSKFFEGVSQMFSTWYGLGLATVCVLGVGLGLYIIAVLCRITALRIRVFSIVAD